MNINATFFVQIINFYIFYSLIKLFLFKPAVRVIDQENNDFMMLENLVDQLKKSIEINEKERQQNWRLYREYAKMHCPEHEANGVYFYKQLSDENHDNAVSEIPSDEDIASFIQGIEPIIEEKIKHVH